MTHASQPSEVRPLMLTSPSYIEFRHDDSTGIRRRGLTVDALRTFMLAQGPSQSQMLLEWDGIWATNKKIIDPVVPRFWAIAKDKKCAYSFHGRG